MISSTPLVLFVNHLLAQEAWARQKLQAHAGKSACIDLQAMRLQVSVTADGMLENADARTEHQVTIRLQLADLPLIAQNRERAFSYVKIEGDADFANTISYLSQHLRWEVEDDLSKLFGDVAAVRMVAGSKSLFANLQRGHQALQENLAEVFSRREPHASASCSCDCDGTRNQPIT